MKLQLNPQAFFELVIQPTFADINPGDSVYPDTLHLFEVVDNVSLANGMTMVDIFQNQNVLRRKDRSCNTVWDKLVNAGTRRLTVAELTAATKFCQEEFYAGALKDLRDQPELFRNLVMDSLTKAVRMDMRTNVYFGDITRPEDPNKIWNWRAYDGIIVKIAEYVTLGTIPAGQLMAALPSGAITPLQAYNALQDAFSKRSQIMKTILPGLLSFTVDFDFAEAYWDYLRSTGANTTDAIGLIMNGQPALAFKGIPIYIENTWNPVLNALNGGIDAHMCILTINGNFVFGTDKKYGGGANLDQAVRMWWSEDDEEWKKKMYMVAGTQIRSPQHIVFGMTNIA